MGFFSFTCAKSNLPTLASTSWGDHPFTQVVLIDKDGVVAQGTYDGYGRIFGTRRSGEGGLDIVDEGFYDRLGEGEVKIVLKSHYDPNDSFESLGRSHSDPGQGHFHDDTFIEACREVGGFSSFDDYAAAYEHFADEDGDSMTAGDLLAWKMELEASGRAGPAP